MSADTEALEAAIETVEVHLMRYPTRDVEQAFELILCALRENSFPRSTGNVVQERKCRCGVSHFRNSFFCCQCDRSAANGGVTA